MRVELWSGDYLPNPGGIAAHVAGLARGLARAGANPVVVVPSRRRNPFAARLRFQPGVPPVVTAGIPRRPLESSDTAYARFARRVRAHRELRLPDVLHWHTPLLESELAGVVTARLKVFTNHTSQFLEWQNEGRDPLQARRSLAAAQVVICPSLELAQATVAAGFPEARVHVVPNGVDTESFAPDVDGRAIRGELGVTHDETLFLCPRRLERKNGVRHWLGAIPLLIASTSAPVRFLLVGDYMAQDQYSERTEVIQMLKGLSGRARVSWIGSVPPARMPGYMAAADAVVLPSLMEATSIAGLEAMASGKPLIGTDVGGLPELIEPGVSGLLVPPGDSEALAAAMRRLAEDAGLRAAMGARGRVRVLQDFSWDRIARRTMDIYRSAASESAAFGACSSPPDRH